MDNWWEPASYPAIDPNSPIFLGSLSLGGIALAFNPEYIDPDSTWTVNFNDQFDRLKEIEQNAISFNI